MKDNQAILDKILAENDGKELKNEVKYAVGKHPNSIKARLLTQHKKGWVNSPETRRKISIAKTGKPFKPKNREEWLRKLRECHLGKKQTEEHKRNSGLARKGEKCCAWKGGLIGYHHTIARNTMEQILGRKLLGDETVHHLDGNYKNNNPNNLYLFSNRGEHTRYHCVLRHLVQVALRGGFDDASK